MTQPINRVGVVGCGLMGAGIAEVCAKTGDTVIVREVNRELMEAGIARIRSSLDRAVTKGKLAANDRDAASPHYRSDRIARGSDRDLIIEAAVENLDLKRRIFAELDVVGRRIDPRQQHLVAGDHPDGRGHPAAGQGAGPAFHAAGTRHVAAGDGTHVPHQRIILSRPRNRSGRAPGKTIIISKDSPGFIVNRLLIPYLLQAIEALERV